MTMPEAELPPEIFEPFINGLSNVEIEVSGVIGGVCGDPECPYCPLGDIPDDLGDA